MKIIRKSPRIADGKTIEDRPHLYRDLPKKYPDGYFQLVHPRRTEGHNLIRNATLVGHIEEAAELVERGYRLRMSEMGEGVSPALVLSVELEIKR